MEHGRIIKNRENILLWARIIEFLYFGTRLIDLKSMFIVTNRIWKFFNHISQNNVSKTLKHYDLDQ